MRLLLAALMVIGFAGAVYAAPVGLTSEADATKAEWSYNDATVSIGFIADSLERDIDIDRGEFEMSAYAARLGLNITERLNIYVDLGQATDMELSCMIKGENIKYEIEDEFLWGIGGNLLIYRWDNGLEIGGNAAYRQADMTLDKAFVDSAQYDIAALAGVKDGEYKDWHIACELAWKTDYLIPYVGVRYSDVEVDGYFEEGGEAKDAQGSNSSENIGAFVGLTITPKLEGSPRSEQISINLEGRFIDEEAFSVGVNYKF